MKFVIEAETKRRRALVAGDPVLLEPLRNASGAPFERARDAAVAAGTLWRNEVYTAGCYPIHLYVDEEPPPELDDILGREEVIERFPVASGRLVVGGEECVVTNGEGGREIGVPPGTYRLSSCPVMFPPSEELVERRFAAAATPEQRRAWERWHRWILSELAVLAGILAFCSAALLYLLHGSCGEAMIPVALMLAATFAAAGYRLTPNLRSADRLYASLAAELPSLVLILRRIVPPTDA